jgi:aminoglycoside phosphotransferase (APT) family kinase protein
VDPCLPAATWLTGPDACEVIGAAVTAAGGRLHRARPCQVHYRPGHEMVVRYRCEVTWPGRDRAPDTILAATTRHGALPATVPVVAETDAGPLAVSVWRWPHDPVLVGLPAAVVGPSLAARLPALVGPVVAVEVVAYRPTERAVVRARTAGGDTYYVKVLAPAAVDAVADRHRRLTEAGLPAPPIRHVDPDLGLLVMAELPGATFRDRIKRGRHPWPAPSALRQLALDLASVDAEGLAPRPTRTADAIGHARLLEQVLTGVRNRRALDDLGRIVSRCGDAIGDSHWRVGPLVHGDLHEAQLIVDDRGRIAGLLDVDDVGPGDPVDDAAVLLAHLRYRACTDPARRDEITAYAARLRASAARRIDAPTLDLVTAGVLVGLATGPFRIQCDRWEDHTAAVLADAGGLLG